MFTYHEINQSYIVIMLKFLAVFETDLCIMEAILTACFGFQPRTEKQH